MDIEFPDPSDSSNTAENNSEDNENTGPFSGRNADMESYWMKVDTERYIQKLCQRFSVGTQETGYAQYKKVEDESPLAADGLLYYRAKKELASELSDRRQDGDWTDEMTLPGYKEQVGVPDLDCTVISAENADEFGLSPDQFDDDEEIHLPDEYELPTDDDGQLVVWYDQPVTTERVLESLQSVKGIGDKKAGKALNKLQADGLIEVED